MNAPPTLADIARAIETWAPPATAQSYDNVGLQIGRAARPVAKALIALDLTPAVCEEAISLMADVVITHHPLLFRPLKRLTDAGLESSMALRLAEAGVALYAAHTNLDAARGGVSFALAEQLGLEQVRFLGHSDESQMRKLIVFVPASHLDPVRLALAEAGAGRIGAYSSCAFASPGTGYFRPDATARPYIGEPGGDTESVDEYRLEVEVPSWGLADVVTALRSTHPYETPVFDVLPMEKADANTGLGAIGVLPEPESLKLFMDRICDRLQTRAVRFAGSGGRPIQTVAVCGGSGSDFTRDALRAGADAYVTGDITYHRYFDVVMPSGEFSMALIDAGHYETEAVTESLLQRRMSALFPQVEWVRTKNRTGPTRWHVRS